MDVAAHQEKGKNEMSKRKAGEERQATDFKEAAYCLSAVVQGEARQKNSLV